MYDIFNVFKEHLWLRGQMISGCLGIFNFFFFCASPSIVCQEPMTDSVLSGYTCAAQPCVTETFPYWPDGMAIGRTPPPFLLHRLPPILYVRGGDSLTLRTRLNFPTIVGGGYGRRTQSRTTRAIPPSLFNDPQRVIDVNGSTLPIELESFGDLTESQASRSDYLYVLFKTNMTSHCVTFSPCWRLAFSTPLVRIMLHIRIW